MLDKAGYLVYVRISPQGKCDCAFAFIIVRGHLQLRQLKNVLRPGSDLAFKRPRLASSGHESASFANDGDNATSWTSHVHDTEAFWQVGA